ncbi:MAG: lipoyl(octanoyl) transferase LipB [Planctomycetes bacterium]|nr:lipoyl(octanoyl) transferase LipB [Planctomycetota bacterium]
MDIEALGRNVSYVRGKELMKKVCTVFRLGVVPYDEALSFQYELVERAREKKGKEHFLILLEHEPVITVGKNGKSNNILASDETLKKNKIIVRKIDRGGDVTYHGPGQLVGYPILSLAYLKKSVREYIRTLEECMVQTLSAFGVKGGGDTTTAGVWVDDAKIGFIGVRVSRGITHHGFSFNVNPDLDAFRLINPCGMMDKKITSLENLKKDITMNDVAKEYIDAFGKLFGIKTVVVKTHLTYIPKVDRNG